MPSITNSPFLFWHIISQLHHFCQTVIQDIFQAGFKIFPSSPIPQRRNLIFQLPPELLDEVESHLSLQYKACLALTCKKFYKHFGSVLSAPEFRLPDFDYSGTYKSTPSTWMAIRWDLLRLLENDKWPYCAGCLRLHPRNEFSTESLELYRADRYCNLVKECGVVDMCPCIKLTFRDKIHLATYLKRLKRGTESDIPTNALICHKFTADPVESCLWHTCSKHSRFTSVRKTFMAFLNKDGDFMIETHMVVNSGLQFHELGLNIRCLPDYWPHNFLVYATSRFPMRLCDYIYTMMEPAVSSFESELTEFSFKFMRNFGKEEVALYHTWTRHCEPWYSRLNGALMEYHL